MSDFNDEILNIPFNLYRTAILIRSEITRRLTKEFKEDFTADYWHILNTLISNQPVTSAKLAELTGRDKASISRSLGCMERLDLISRLANPNNKKSELLTSTKFALEFKTKAELIIKGVLAESLKKLKPIEIIELNRMLSTISTSMNSVSM